MKLSIDGDFSKTKSFLKNLSKKQKQLSLDDWGRAGVAALSSATPVDTGKTASSWSYSIEQRSDGVSLVWNNSNVNDGVNIALIIQYGHVTRNGAYVQGRDYINPALVPIFDKLAESAWKEVKDIG